MLSLLSLCFLARAVEPDTAAQAPKLFRHGFRLGYAYVNGAEQFGIDPNLFVFGYEANQKVIGGEWLDVVLVENVVLAGINQGYALPSANLIVGIEIADSVQVGTGINISALSAASPIGQVIAIGYMPQVGRLQMPVHLSYVPAPNHWRIAATTGVNW